MEDSDDGKFLNFVLSVALLPFLSDFFVLNVHFSCFFINLSVF